SARRTCMLTSRMTVAPARLQTSSRSSSTVGSGTTIITTMATTAAGTPIWLSRVLLTRDLGLSGSPSVGCREPPSWRLTDPSIGVAQAGLSGARLCDAPIEAEYAYQQARHDLLEVDGVRIAVIASSLEI